MARGIHTSAANKTSHTHKEKSNWGATGELELMHLDLAQPPRMFCLVAGLLHAGAFATGTGAGAFATDGGAADELADAELGAWAPTYGHSRP